MIPKPKDPAHVAWTRLTHPIVDPFSAFMAGFRAGHKEGFAAGCENCLGLEPIQVQADPSIPTIEQLREQMNRPWAPRRLCELLRGRR